MLVRRLTLQNAGIGATLSITTSEWHTQAQARA
jgi:hypothetical protein